MRIIISIILLILMSGSVHAWDMQAMTSTSLLYESAVSDTSKNPVLQDMLSQFIESPEASSLPYDSWTLTLHRYLGYTIVAATVTQVVLGSITWNDRKKGREPSTRTAHKYLGYSTAGISLVQSSLGYANYWKMRNKESGNKKRMIHLGLSTLATAGFITAAILAYNARHDIEDGTAARENKTFDDLYSNHRTIGILSGVSVLLTAIVIEW